MTKYKYLIIGGGMTAAAAMEGIREVDSSGSIGLISAEPDAPYNRPPLTKSLWKGEKFDSIWRRIDNKEINTHYGSVVKEIDNRHKRVVDEKGTVYNYEKLLLATGGTPRRLPFGDEHFIYYRTLSDYRRLRELTNTGKRFAVIGGGFIGSEIAAALAMNGKEVVIIFPDKYIGQRIFPKPLAEFVSNYYKQKGVEVLAGEKIVAWEILNRRHFLISGSGKEITVDGVVAGLGIEPNTELARNAGLEVGNGIIVDEYLHTSSPDIFAAGDVAEFFNPALGNRTRVEHEDNANTMGKMAGWNMAGKAESYDHLPFFYSDLFDLGYEAVGDVDSKLETFADWKRPNEEGVIYYLKNNRVRGVLLWNVWEQVEAARQLIAEPGPFTNKNLVGRLPAV